MWGCKFFEKKVVKIFGLCCGMSVSLHPQMRDSGPDNNREDLIVRCRKKKFSKKAILICTIEKSVLPLQNISRLPRGLRIRRRLKELHRDESSTTKSISGSGIPESYYRSFF